MIGFGTILNTLAIVAGGLLGGLFGRFLGENVQDGVIKACGISTLFIGLSGTLEKMLSVENGVVVSSGSMLIIACLVIGGIAGELLDIEGGLFGRFLGENVQDGVIKACGISTLFIGLSGTLEKMLSVENGVVVSSGSMLIIACLVIGGIAGELLNIEGGFERFGSWLKIKSGNAKDKRFVEAFVTASLTVCIGAMAIVGSISDGLTGDYSILATKSILDLIIIMVMSCSLGKGAVFSAIPVAIFQGSITVLAGLLRPIMTTGALNNLSLVGNVLIFCVGVNLVWGKHVKVANLLPGIVVAVAAAFL